MFRIKKKKPQQKGILPSEAASAVRASVEELEPYNTVRLPPVINGLIPEVPDHRGSGFRAILKHLDPSAVRRILEVGVSSGARTTVHLVDLFDAPIDIVERDQARADSTRERFASLGRITGQVSVYNKDIRNYHPESKYDLIVLDVPTAIVPFAYTDLLERLRPYENPSCKYIVYTLYDCSAAFANQPVADQTAQQLRQFTRDYFGTSILTFDVVRRTMSSKGFQALGLVDNWMRENTGFGHVLLERL